MKKHIYLEIGVFATGLLGAGVFHLFKSDFESTNSYFLIILGSLLLFIILNNNHKKGNKK